MAKSARPSLARLLGPKARRDAALRVAMKAAAKAKAPRTDKPEPADKP